MSRKRQLADADPFGGDDEGGEKQHNLSMGEADVALFGELAKRDSSRHTVRPVSIFDIDPDVQQPRRAIPPQVRSQWSGQIYDITSLFNIWINYINDERQAVGRGVFDLGEYLSVTEGDLEERNDPGPMENSLLNIVALAVSIRRDNLANPITVQRISGTRYQIETGERRWLAFHLLNAYFEGERDRWGTIPAIVVDQFNVWRQASENSARSDLNAIGRARQYALLMMDLLKSEHFDSYSALIKPGESDRAYYAQVVAYRVPKGKGDMLLNALGVSHRAAFARCRTLLSLPDEIWLIGDVHDLPEDKLLRLAKIGPVDKAIDEARKMVANVASRNNTKSTKPPTLFADPALKRGKRLFSTQNEQAAKEIFMIRSGVGQASGTTKAQVRAQIDELRRCLDRLEKTLDS
jgi:hypothetical protein